ncbi:lipoate--protein ligase family protein, partial [Psychrobacillus psychrotolerans]|uniref:lipoate--protein ligase family protein n=1 Tax=Psychrobacillus psychrotolerans TaxID=126156 RepID=UPI003C71CA3E
LVVEGKKVAGSAQTRQKGVILQHGAILLDLDEDKLIQTFKFASEEIREKVRKGLSQKAVSINKIISKPVTMEECKIAFKNGFADALEIELVEYNLTQEQKNYVKQLEVTRYANDKWNYKK